MQRDTSRERLIKRGRHAKRHEQREIDKARAEREIDKARETCRETRAEID